MEEVIYKPNNNHYENPLISMQRIKREKAKCIPKENQQNMKDKRLEKIFRNNHKTSNKLTGSTYLSIITLEHLVHLNSNKRYRVTEWNKNHLYATCKRLNLDRKTPAG